MNKKYLVPILGIVLGLGILLGRATAPETIREIEVVEERPFLDFTLSREEQVERINLWANTLNLAVISYKDYWEKKQELDMISYKEWQQGYRAGYVAGRAE